MPQLSTFYDFSCRSKALAIVQNLSALTIGATLCDLTSLEGLVRLLSLFLVYEIPQLHVLTTFTTFFFLP